MAKESDFQAKVIKQLKAMGLAVVKNQAGPGVPTGFPDLSWWYKSKYGFLDVKRSQKASFRPRQKEWLEQLRSWGYARVVFPENYDIIKEEILLIVKEEDAKKETKMEE